MIKPITQIFFLPVEKKMKKEKPIKSKRKTYELFHQKTAFQNECHAEELHIRQARSKDKMTGGAKRVARINSLPPASVPRLKRTSWYISYHYICLQYLLFLSLIFRLG